MEAEYRVIASATVKTTWILNLLFELRISLPRPLMIKCDNLDSTYLYANLVFHFHMEHLALDYHFV